MGKLIVKPDNKKGALRIGRTLLSYLQELEIEINASCGGHGICRGCLVKVYGDGKLSNLTEVERKSIKNEEYRLACQAKIINEDEDIYLEVPKYGKYKILEKGVSKKIRLNPFVKKRGAYPIEKIYWKNKEIDNYNGEIYGLALDVGTTTLSMYWVDLTTGHERFVSSVLNPQLRYGDNIIDRINYAKMSDQKHLEKVARKCVNEMILRGPINPKNIYELVVVGNTAMRDIWIGHSVRKLGESPFEPISLKPVNLNAYDLGLAINQRANVYAPPLIGHFVGADALSVILATEMHKCPEILMTIDIGTNTEIAIGNEEKIIVTSCASGPAFEGSGIKCGTGAVEGAIQKVEIDDDLKVIYETIDGASPIGLCGSGLIDVLAQMLDKKIIDWRGKFSKDVSEFIIAKEGNGIFLDGEDIDNLKLAKAAISVGIKVVMEHYGVEINDIKKLYLAGAFGTYINPNNALKIGMLPDLRKEKVVQAGNAAIEGARQILISKEKRKEAEEIPRICQHIRLEKEKDFHDRFVEELCFDKYRI